MPKNRDYVYLPSVSGPLRREWNTPKKKTCSEKGGSTRLAWFGSLEIRDTSVTRVTNHFHFFEVWVWYNVMLWYLMSDVLCVLLTIEKYLDFYISVVNSRRVPYTHRTNTCDVSLTHTGPTHVWRHIQWNHHWRDYLYNVGNSVSCDPLHPWMVLITPETYNTEHIYLNSGLFEGVTWSET